MIYSPKEAIGFCCDPLPSGTGYTWSLTTWLGKLLRDAERQYGPRDKNWTILGVEFCGEIPHLWYPGNIGNISIMLTDSARLDPKQAMFQLAHEVIHLLAPNGGGSANVIEEGIATAFAHQNSTLISAKSSYQAAEEQVLQLLQADASAILKLRTLRPSFSDFTPEFIVEQVQIPVTLAVSLCEPFQRG